MKFLLAGCIPHGGRVKMAASIHNNICASNSCNAAFHPRSSKIFMVAKRNDRLGLSLRGMQTKPRPSSIEYMLIKID